MKVEGRGDTPAPPGDTGEQASGEYAAPAPRDYGAPPGRVGSSVPGHRGPYTPPVDAASGPTLGSVSMKPWRITWHVSDLAYGTLEGIRTFHVERRGWRDIGYHAVITNGRPGHARDGVDRSPAKAVDGGIWYGRDTNVQGAGVRGENEGNLHLCMVGLPGEVTVAQLEAAFRQTREWMNRFTITPDDVRGHCEYDAAKRCPGLDMSIVRAALSGLRYPQGGA